MRAAVLVEPGLIEMQRRRVPPKAIDLVDADRTPSSVKTVVALS